MDNDAAPDTVVVSAPPAKMPMAWRVLLGIGRTVLTLASVVVLVAAGYGWSTLHRVTAGLVITNVIDHPAPQPGSPINILLVGMDSRTNPHGDPLPQAELSLLNAGPDTGELDTDTMILIHIPADGQHAVAISFPRDSFVQLAGGYGKHKLNSAFAYAHNAAVTQLTAAGDKDPADVEQQADTAGRKNLIATIESLVGNSLSVDRYAEINLVGFYQISQAVGGVEVCLKAATHDDETGASFPAGPQLISGVQALDFVRQRHGLPGGDLDRIKRQQVFLAGLANKIFSAGTLTNPSELNNLITAVQNSVTLGNGWDITSFVAQLQQLSSSSIQFATIPIAGSAQNSDGDVLLVNPTQVQQFVRTLLNGGTSSSSPTTTTTTGTAPAIPQNLSTSPSMTAPPPSGVISSSGVPCVN